ncbi:hypothetical protein NDU88_003494 [Pleurodeles waltl]|uniref:Uncharacterized protein n=1 Tax=Pleurodeles waltl TaxID=8319 RepID=A0AAV7SFV9_PLEWA|nr:hypothetical protein NDU88_003494 [Pleurodeles waltl]
MPLESETKALPQLLLLSAIDPIECAGWGALACLRVPSSLDWVERLLLALYVKPGRVRFPSWPGTGGPAPYNGGLRRSEKRSPHSASLAKALVSTIPRWRVALLRSNSNSVTAACRALRPLAGSEPSRSGRARPEAAGDLRGAERCKRSRRLFAEESHPACTLRLCHSYAH